jgi:2-methylisocitrate lyase-like PEP mutase family enzyme
LKDLDAIRMVCASLSKPVNVIMGLPGATFSVRDLEEAGVKRISVGSALARLAYSSVVAAAQEMLDPGTFTWANEALGFRELERLVTGSAQG